MLVSPTLLPWRHYQIWYVSVTHPPSLETLPDLVCWCHPPSFLGDITRFGMLVSPTLLHWRHYQIWYVSVTHPPSLETLPDLVCWCHPPSFLGDITRFGMLVSPTLLPWRHYQIWYVGVTHPSDTRCNMKSCFQHLFCYLFHDLPRDPPDRSHLCGKHSS